MDRPSEEQRQRGEDSLPYVSQDCVQQVRDGFPPAWPFLFERYAEGKTDVHVHLWLRIGKDVARYFCAHFQNWVPALFADWLREAVVDGSDGHLNSRYSYEGEAVLLDVREICESGKKVRIIRSRVRLQTLNDCLHRVGEALQIAAFQARPIHGIGTDRKLAILFDVLRNGDSEIPVMPLDHSEDHVIEGRAELIQAFSCGNAQVGWLPNGLNPVDVLSSICLQLSPVHAWVGFDELLHPHLKAYQVLFGPSEFLVDARLQRTHG